MAKQIKIALFIDSFFPMIDGVTMVVDNYARRLSKFCDVTVFAPSGRSKFDDSKLPYKVCRCNIKLPVVFLDYDLPLANIDAKLKNTLKSEHFDLVHIHSPFSMGKLGLKYAIKRHIPCIATMHSQFEQDFYKSSKSKVITKLMLNKIMKVYNSCTECWAVNNAIAKIFLEYGAKTTPKIQHNGTDLLPFTNLDEIKKLKEQYNLKDEKILLFVGRFSVLKNILFIVDSLNILKQKGFKFKMFFIGGGHDENLLKKHIKELNLQNEIILVSPIHNRVELSKYYKMADLFLFPSLYDASSLVQIEAASQSTPTLFVKDSATSNTIIENINGYVSTQSAEAYANKIIDIFNDTELYLTISNNVYNDLYLSWDTCVEKAYYKYLDIINKFNIENKMKPIKKRNGNKKRKAK